ncbi:hypothetical protein [Nannocystis pusilla]|uniref:hypothetical protein n=1 Tax=Nannocystis pusilla TaxID=889268 RepID=UPI003BF003EE
MRSAAIALVTLLSLSPVTAAAAPDDPERVVMKLDEFLKLYEKTRAEETTAPLDYALSSARYEGEVQLKDGEPYAAVFKARFRVEVLRAKGFAKVPFLPATVALESAKIGNAEAAVVIEDGHYVLVTQQRGALTLDVTFAAAVTTAEGSSGVSFQLSPAGATSAVLSVPAREDLDFTVAGAKLQSDKVVGEKRVVEAVLPSTGALEVKWQRELPKAAQQASRVLSEVYTLVSLGEGLMRATTTAQYTILFTGVDKLALKVPKDMTVLDVVGAGVREWKVDGEGNLGVQLNYAAKGAYSLRIEMEKVVRGDIKDVAAPVPVPVGVERARGFVGVESRGNLEVDAGDVKGATPVDVRALPAAILGITGQPVLLGYKYLGTDVSIPLSAWQHVDADVLVTLLDETRARTMWTREGRRLTSVKYRIRNNRRQFLRLALPKGGELWSASVGGRAVQPALAADKRVMIPLVRSQAAGGELAAFEVEIVYVENGAPPSDNGRGQFAATLPRADAPCTYVAWTVYAPDDAKVKRWSIDGNLRKVRYLSNPIPAEDMNYVQTATPQMAEAAQNQAAPGGSLGDGAMPVPVSLPLQGREVHFEKLLALDEELTIGFKYRGLKKR